MKALHIPNLRITPRDCTLFGLGALVAIAAVATHAFINKQHVPLADKTHRIAIPWLPSSVTRWQEPIVEMAGKYNIDPELLAILMTMESGGYSQARSEADAVGLMQVTPPTAGDIASKFLKEPVTTYNLTDAKTNIEFGAAYLAYLRDEFGTVQQGPSWISTVELLAAGYNGGPGAANDLEQGRGLNDTETIIYARDAFNMWRERHSQKSPTYDRWLERGGSALVEKAQTESNFQ